MVFRLDIPGFVGRNTAGNFPRLVQNIRFNCYTDGWLLITAGITGKCATARTCFLLLIREKNFTVLTLICVNLP